MGRFDRQQLIESWDQETLRQKHVLVVGAGTTGNEVIKNLALLGVGRLTVVDFDLVEEVNLSRCVLFRPEDVGQPKALVASSRARDLYPQLEARGILGDVVHDIGLLDYLEFACVVLTVDNLEARMWVNRACWRTRRPLVETGIGGLNGNVFVAVPPTTSCIECMWAATDYSRLAERLSCSREGLVETDRKIAMVITTAAIVAGVACQDVVALLQPRVLSRQPLGGRLTTYYGASTSLAHWGIPPKVNCLGHQDGIPASSPLAEVQRDTSVDAAQSLLRNQLSADVVELTTAHEIVYSLTCNHCFEKVTSDPVFVDRFRRRICPKCQWLSLVPEERSSQLKNGYSFRQLGIPVNDLVRVHYARGSEIEQSWLHVR